MFLTIFTPTYNWAETLRRVFDSLRVQNIDGFEWLVIDDGSTDDTRRLMGEFMDEALFTVRYHYREHGGKHRAYNDALKLARGKFFFTVDSDDWLSAGSLDVLLQYLPQIYANDSVCGIVALKEDPKGYIYGRRLDVHDNIISLQDLEKMRRTGERSYIFKTEVARRYPFPTIDEENFVTESVVYDRIGADWKFLTIDRPLTVCEYQKDGLSGNIYQLMWNIPQGFIIYHRQRIVRAYSLSKVIRHTLRYHAFRHIAGRRFRGEKYTGRYSVLVRLLSFVGPLGRLYYKYKCRTATLKQ